MCSTYGCLFEVVGPRGYSQHMGPVFVALDWIGRHVVTSAPSDLGTFDETLQTYKGDSLQVQERR